MRREYCVCVALALVMWVAGCHPGGEAEFSTGEPCSDDCGGNGGASAGGAPSKGGSAGAYLDANWGGFAGDTGPTTGSGPLARGGAAGALGVKSGGAGGAHSGCQLTMDEEGALLVDAEQGNDDTGTGSSDHPYRTLQAAIADAAANSEIRRIYLATGMFIENVRLESLPSTISIVGGWEPQASGWMATCDPRGTELLAADVAKPAVEVAGGTTVAFQYLTVRTHDTVRKADANKAGATLLAMNIRGTGDPETSPHVALNSVVVEAGNAGEAGDASDGAAGSTRTCSGVTDCVGTPAPGESQAKAAKGQLGTFSADGYQPLMGEEGSTGLPGTNGEPGGVSASLGCVSACTPTGSLGGCDASRTTRSSQGLCGCGGKGGEPGAPGQGGGASVAILVSGAGAAVEAIHSTLRTGKGGAGSRGGSGGAGGPPTQGRTGSGVMCNTQCLWNSGCYAGQQKSTAGGAAGGPGQPGGKGPDGGDGAGGPSFGVVILGGAQVDIPDELIEFGQPGVDGDGGLNGDSAASKVEF